MKRRKKLVKSILTSMISLSSLIIFIGTSAVFFGEYPYPQQPSQE